MPVGFVAVMVPAWESESYERPPRRSTDRHTRSLVGVRRSSHVETHPHAGELTTVLAIRKILTPEQFSKVTAAMDEMKKAGTGQLAPPVSAF